MADVMIGAAVGFVFTEFGTAVKEAIKRADAFKDELIKLEETLQNLDPMIQDIQRMGEELNESAQKEVRLLTSIMKEGHELVSKCHSISSWWKAFKKSSYQKKLVELDSKIMKFLISHIQLGTFLEVKKVRVELSQLESRLDGISCQIESLKPWMKPDEAGGHTDSTAQLESRLNGIPCQIKCPIKPWMKLDEVGGHTNSTAQLESPWHGISCKIESLNHWMKPDEVHVHTESTAQYNDVEAPRIGPSALIVLILFGGIHTHIIVKITAIGIIIYKALEAIKSCLSEKSLTVVWTDLFDLGFLGSFVPSPDSTTSAITTGLILLLVFSIGNEILKITIICYIISQVGLGMVIKDLVMLETTIKQLQDTMKSLDQVLKDIESNSEAAESLRNSLEEGKKLLSETSELGWWNFVKKWQYQKKMVELENKLLRFHSLHLRARLDQDDYEKKHDDDSEMKDDESPRLEHYDKDRYERKSRHTNTKENKSYDTLMNNVNRYQFLANNPSISSSIGGIQHTALGR